MKIDEQITKEETIDELNNLIYDLQFVIRMCEDDRPFWLKKISNSSFNLFNWENPYPFYEVKKKEFLINKRIEMAKRILEIIKNNNFSEKYVISFVPQRNFEYKRYLLNLMRDSRKND